jgi:hypothetical protein
MAMEMEILLCKHVQMPVSDNQEPIETSRIASFDANYSGSKTDEIRILVEYRASSSPSANDENIDDDSSSLAHK